MDETVIRIDELRLRIPGMAPEEARGLAQQFVRALAGQPALGGVRPQDLGALQVRVPIPTGTPASRIPGMMAQAILKGLPRCNSR